MALLTVPKSQGHRRLGGPRLRRRRRAGPGHHRSGRSGPADDRRRTAGDARPARDACPPRRSSALIDKHIAQPEEAGGGRGRTAGAGRAGEADRPRRSSKRSFSRRQVQPGDRRQALFGRRRSSSSASGRQSQPLPDARRGLLPGRGHDPQRQRPGRILHHRRGAAAGRRPRRRRGSRATAIRAVPVDNPEWVQGFNSPDELLAIQDYVRRKKLRQRPRPRRRSAGRS